MRRKKIQSDSKSTGELHKFASANNGRRLNLNASLKMLKRVYLLGQRSLKKQWLSKSNPLPRDLLEF